MIKPLAFEVPFPPSVNGHWRHVNINGSPRTLVSKKGRQYKQAVQQAWYVVVPHGFCTIRDPVQMSITFYPPDRRRRDLDNYCKGLLDSLQAAGIIADDSLIHDLHLRWGVRGDAPACAMVTIRSLNNAS